LSRLARCDRATPTLGEQQLWKRKFAARDFGRDAPRKVVSIRQTDSGDSVSRAQATEISRYFWPQEITSVRPDCLVELRGFELGNPRRPFAHNGIPR
jgi:hypothetical protein